MHKKKMKLVVYSIFGSIMDVYRGLKEDNWKATREYVSWGKKESGEVEHGTVVDSPFIVVDEDRDIKKIEESEAISFMLNIIFEEYAAESESKILSGFYSETMDAMYGFELKDQGNFTQQLLLLTLSGDIYDYKTIAWKTEDKGILEHTQEQFVTVCKEGEAHKRGEMNLYWSLKKHLVETVTTFKDFDTLGDYQTELDKMLKPEEETA